MILSWGSGCVLLLQHKVILKHAFAGPFTRHEFRAREETFYASTWPEMARGLDCAHPFVRGTDEWGHTARSPNWRARFWCPVSTVDRLHDQSYQAGLPFNNIPQNDACSALIDRSVVAVRLCTYISSSYCPSSLYFSHYEKAHGRGVDDHDLPATSPAARMQVFIVPPFISS